VSEYNKMPDGLLFFVDNGGVPKCSKCGEEAKDIQAQTAHVMRHREEEHWKEERQRMEAELDAVAREAGFSSPANQFQAMLDEDKNWREKIEAREIDNYTELEILLAEGEIANVSVPNETTVEIQYYGDRKNGEPAEHLRLEAVIEDGKPRLKVTRTTTSWTRIEGT
jgi:hypothetical protein